MLPLKEFSRRSFTLSSLSMLLLGLTQQASAHTEKETSSQKVLERKISTEDRLDIIELMAIYAWSYDCNDAVGLANTFTPDGSLEIFGKEIVKGRASMDGFIEMAKKMRGQHSWQHITDHHHFCEYTGTTCKVYSYYLMPEGDENGSNGSVRAMGYYVSHCVKKADKWFFSKREVFRWNGQIPWAKNTV